MAGPESECVTEIADGQVKKPEKRSGSFFPSSEGTVEGYGLKGSVKRGNEQRKGRFLKRLFSVEIG
jgi:hypothetical protein